MGNFFTSSGASFSGENKEYRDILWRLWDDKQRPLIFIGLNPSTADAETDDPTVHTLTVRARREGFGGLVVMNLYSFRATEPKDLLKQKDPVGPENHKTLLRFITKNHEVLAGWGDSLPDKHRANRVINLLVSTKAKLTTLGFTKADNPRHPLYIRITSPRQPWRPWSLPV